MYITLGEIKKIADDVRAGVAVSISAEALVDICDTCAVLARRADMFQEANDKARDAGAHERRRRVAAKKHSESLAKEARFATHAALSKRRKQVDELKMRLRVAKVSIDLMKGRNK